MIQTQEFKMKFALKVVAATAAVLCVGTAFAQKGEVVKMVRIDPLTGLLGPVVLRLALG